MAILDYIPSENDGDFDPSLRRAFEFASQNVDSKLVDHSKVKIRKDSILASGDGAFFTLQGEGPTMGLPCVFFRLHVCNLRCTWCDAFYTWNPNSEEFWTESFRLSFEEAAKRISDCWQPKDDSVPKRVIFTGGEPLIQKNQIDQVMKILNHGWLVSGRPWHAEFETNGTLMPTEAQLRHAQFNCSPKLANSDNKHHAMVKPKVLAALNEANTTFKFVCRDATDLDEIEEVYLPHISKDKVIIMPEGIREQEITGHARQLYEPCMERGYRMMPRFQAIFADGAKRGV